MSNTVDLLLLGIGIATLLSNLVGVLLSMTDSVSYYPLGERGWQFYFFWTLAHANNAALVALGYRQFGDLGLPLWAVSVGGLLFLAGFGIVIVATADLGVSQTQGIEEMLQTDGLYSYSRNPQYVGYILATVGYALFVNAPYVGPICLLLLLWWIVLPFVEEPWLRAQYGREYERYTEQVPRFIGTTSQREADRVHDKSEDG